MTRLWQRFLISLIAIFWLVGVIVLYYAGHKPFSPQFALNLVKAAGQFTSALLILVAAGGLGRQFMPETDLPPLSVLTLQASLGLGLLGLAVLIVGTLAGINSTIGWAFLIFLGILLWRYILSWLMDLRLIGTLWHEAGKLGKLTLFGASLVLLVTLSVALAPPLKFDALVYHLALPRAYLGAGKIVYIPQFMYWGMPQIGEMLFTWGMSLAGNETATLLCWMTGLLVMVGMMNFIADRLGKQASWVSLAAMLSVGTMLALLPAGYIDWLVVLFGFCFMVFMVCWWDSGDLRHLIMGGVFAGFALGSKYTAGVLWIAGIIIILVRGRKHIGERYYLVRNLACFALPAIGVTLPWLLKNGLATGNPFYPFLFPTGGMDQFRLDFYQIGVWGDWRDWLFLPLRATITGYEGTPGYSATLSPLLLGLCPLAILAWRASMIRQRAVITIAAAIGLTGLVIWAIASRFSGYLVQSRLYFAIFPAFTVLASAGYLGISRIRFPGVRMSRITGILVLMVFGFAVLQEMTDVINRGSARVIFGLITPETYLRDNLGWFIPASEAINDLPSSARVLMLWEPRAFYCEPKCVPDEVLDRWKHDRHLWGDNNSILSSWRNAGYTHLLYNKFGADFVRNNDARYDSTDWIALENLLIELKQPEDFGGAYFLYSLQ